MLVACPPPRYAFFHPISMVFGATNRFFPATRTIYWPINISLLLLWELGGCSPLLCSAVILETASEVDDIYWRFLEIDRITLNYHCICKIFANAPNFHWNWYKWKQDFCLKIDLNFLLQGSRIYILKNILQSKPWVSSLSMSPVYPFNSCIIFNPKGLSFPLAPVWDENYR